MASAVAGREPSPILLLLLPSALASTQTGLTMLRSALPRLRTFAQPSARIASRTLATEATPSPRRHQTFVEDVHNQTAAEILKERDEKSGSCA